MLLVCEFGRVGSRMEVEKKVEDRGSRIEDG